MKKIIRVGDVKIGGDYPIAVQTMSNLPAADISAVIRQAAECFDAGCKIFRIAVPDFETAAAVKKIKKEIKMPLVADIHFDFRLGIEAAKNGADKLRINPGNMKKDDLKKLVKTAKEYGIPVRVGVNGGSLEKKYAEIFSRHGSENGGFTAQENARESGFILQNNIEKSGCIPQNNIEKSGCVSQNSIEKNGDFLRYGTAGNTRENARFGDGDLVQKRAYALAASAMDGVRLLEERDFFDIVVSLKSSSVRETVAAYRLADGLCGYPLHIGITEAGGERTGLVKSAAGLSALLIDGIGDTLRVSLTADPVKEVAAALSILRAVGIDKNYAEIVSCPKCGRCSYDTERLLKIAEDIVKDVKKPLKIAVMGCVVNGPGEAGECDVGIAFGEGRAAVFKDGKVFKTAECVEAERIFLDKLRELAGG
ncbi:MAG: flavodoxin-dependent (E)-4-hydroxy-3-methylbut-2-enyl-diphosphate synthase [Clostridiales bacterium]|jgi:(E)-4-hydroxy-3-methylbut-2-enyl-diphosphate synthase|nr:flavodoxin-dependent (E)-4-hydroxy-3-methylbut-2-enyl-diphosphate synthase [Clostridiales bacterium]